ncbi:MULTISPECIES: response regulator [Glutamicibacter]|uniref:Response regulator transcription factor n=1 Tax=Glutamicibacter halophytocola TaxID=1933880 RepID=A0A5B8I2X7_9MICC|nr:MULTISPECIES: response regulator transcription factor [Glutamicibacter]ALG27911.1 LuxR family transcriptional regulator [Glutamicibacter halophytocola]MBF6671953.1 response regulator transcription factor [Glutamicibacter sp. FBE19]NQD39701.1 response regulator transcription factor [Glutamicibacter halophytocola]QDY67249.1 response regulator transcription factor [Glutamicibacter halophytocola]UUX59421.1 response regulator transcription factor [Glutamicibacter halophytocola]
MEQIKVLIVDDEPLIRHALGTILATDNGIVTVFSAENGKQAVDYCSDNEIDVVLMDLQMPIMDGVSATRAIKSRKDSPAVLAITAFSSDEYLVPVLTAGASGYLVKDSEPGEIIRAVHAVHQGTAAISPSVSSDLISAVREAYADNSQAVEDIIYDLGITNREIQILKLLAQGLNNTEISKTLGITETTVKTHMAKIFVKLNVRDRVQALVAAARMGIVEIPKH